MNALWIAAALLAIALYIVWPSRRKADDDPPELKPVLPTHGAPEYRNRYQPPEVRNLIQTILNDRAEHGGEWPDYVDMDTRFVIEAHLARQKREAAE